MMLEFLQTGKALYALAVICGLGVITKWLTRNLYKRLIKESDNMTLTKNKNLRSFKQKAETTYQMNQGIPKVKPYLERQMYEFKHMGITFHGWNLLSNQMTLLCFLAGGVGAFASYFLHTDPYYIVMYGSVGILAGLFTILVDHGLGIMEKKQQLFISLDNYLENVLLHRLNQDRGQDTYMERPARQEARDNIRSIYDASESEAGAAGQAEEPVQANLSRRQRLKQERRSRQEQAGQKEQQAVQEQPVQQNAQTLSGRQARQGRQIQRGQENRSWSSEGKDDRMAENGQGNADAVQAASGNRRDVDYLKHSLEQIAASRERQRDVKKEEDWLKDLNPEELKLIGEIIHQYLT